jgi:MFS family permease
MNKDLGLSAYVYGLGAGIFFFGYFMFEVPSNLILERIGARLWIARIMLTWGLISAGMAFVTGETTFLVMRFLLGVAEAVSRQRAKTDIPRKLRAISFGFPPACQLQDADGIRDFEAASSGKNRFADEVIE